MSDESLELQRTYKVHRETHRGGVRRCHLAGCLVTAFWSLRTTFPNGRIRMRMACFTHACEWAREKGLREPRSETLTPSVYVED